MAHLSDIDALREITYKKESLLPVAHGASEKGAAYESLRQDLSDVRLIVLQPSELIT
jgi:hypothetical protein